MVIFESIAAYYGSCTTNDAKIAALDTIIDKILVSAATAADSGHLDEYWWDDGHVKIRTKYRNLETIAKSVLFWEQIRQRYINRKTGNIFRLMDHKSFPPRC